MTDLTFAESSAGHAGQDRWLRIQRVFMGQCLHLQCGADAGSVR